MAVGAEAFGHFGVALVAPVLRTAVEAAGVDAEERAIEAEAASAEAPPRAVANGDREVDDGKFVDDVRRVDRGEELRVIVELVSALADARDAIRQ